MESPPRTPVQPTLTAFFPNAHSRSAPRMGKGGGGVGSAKKKALLSQQKIGEADSEQNNNSSGSGSDLQECITTPAKQASRASAAAAASAGRKRSMTDKTTKTTAASKAKRTRTATTTKRHTSVARSLSISFGPKAVSRLDFSAQSTTTTTSSSVQEIEQEKEEKEEGSTITATTAKTLITEVSSSSSSSSSPSKAPASSSSSEQSTTTTTTTTTSTLNIAAVKERLKSCKSLAQLKSNLSRINNCDEQLKEFKSMKVRLLSPVKSAYVSPSKRSSSSFASPEKLSLSGLTMIPSPLKATAGGKVPAIPSKLTSSPFLANRRAAQEAVAQMPAKLSCSRKLFEEEDAQEDGENSNNNSTMPAHSRFSHLAMPATTTTSKSSSSSPPSPSTEPELPLPSKLTHLLNVFTHMDFIVSRSKETVTFERLKAKVELATRRTFDRPMLAKVLTVLAIEEKQWFKLKSELLRGSSQLIISAAAVDEQVDEQTSTSCLNSYQRLLLRKTAFAKMLLEITKRRHLQFLASVGLTAALSPEKTMFKWHPLFKLDEVDLVPDMSLLPEEKKAVVNNANSILNYFVPVSKTAEAAKAKEAAAEKAAAAATPSPTSTPSKKDVRVKGIRPDLLAKVREKEAARKARLMFRTPETDRKLRLLEQTEPAVRIIASLFTSTAARSFPREKVVKVLADSMKVTSASADALLTYLLSLELLADPTDLDRRWLRPHTSLSDGVSSYIVLQASPRLAFLKEQIARKIAAIKSSD